MQGRYNSADITEFKYLDVDKKIKLYYGSSINICQWGFKEITKEWQCKIKYVEIKDLKMITGKEFDHFKNEIIRNSYNKDP